VNDDVLEESSSGPVRRSPWYIWMAAPLTAVMLLGAIHLVDQPAPASLGGAAARLLPPEGHRSVTLSLDGAETVSEHARSIGIEGAFSAPIAVVSGILNGLGEEELRLAQWWRASSVTDGRRVTDLFRISDEGVTQVASWGNDLGLVFEPELLLLPANVRPGSSWSSEGSALGDGLLTYSADFSARAPAQRYVDHRGVEVSTAGECLEVVATITIVSSLDALTTTIAETALWCEGRGTVWSEGDVDGVPSGLAVLQVASLDAAEGTEVSVPSGRPAQSLDAAERLGEPSALTRVASDPFFGDFDTSGQYPLPPVLAAEGEFVIVNERGDDVQRWRASPEEPVAQLQWAGHPGGTVTALGAAHGVVATATSLRRVSVYDVQGRRVWAMSIDDIVRTPPVAAPQGGLVVVTRAGTVHLMDALSGTERWTTSLGADARDVLEVTDSIVLIADERQRLTALDAASGETLWRVEPGAVEFVAVDEQLGLVAAISEDGAVSGFDIDDGNERWLHVISGTPRGLEVGSAGVLVLTEESAHVLDPSSGAVRWRGPGADSVIMADRIAVLVSENELTLLDVERARVLDRSATPEVALGASRRAVLDGESLVIIDTDGSVVRVGLSGRS